MSNIGNPDDKFSLFTIYPWQLFLNKSLIFHVIYSKHEILENVFI